MRLGPRLLICLTVLLAGSRAAAAAVVYVNASATGANDGSSWANAFTTIGPALTLAGSGDEIWVAAATYKPTTTTDRTLSFALENGVGVYGGFNGTEATRSQRDPVANVTILSGDIGAPSVSNDNSYHVVTADATVTATGILDGFTITSGQADGVNPNDEGGGMRDNGGAPTLSNLIFSGNFALAKGGGLRILNGAPTLLDSSFLSNSVASSGAGGGLFMGSGSNVYAQNCIFRSNTVSGASVGGAGMDVGGTITLVNCVIAQNNPSGAHFSGDNHTIKDCTITNNTAYGVAFFIGNNNTIHNSIIWGNGVDQIFKDGSSSATASYCDIQGGYAGANLDADPLFLAAPSDLRLGPGSPAVDSGNDTLVPGGLIVDLAGLPRFFDDPNVTDTGIGPPGTAIVDMGAYERVPLTISDPGDLTVCSGNSAAFTVTASGQAPLTYQWRKNGADLADGATISGTHTPSLTINPTVSGDAGTYDVLVTDGFTQSLASTPATLVVNDTPIAMASGTAAICSGSSTPLSGSGGVGCSWSPGAGLDEPGSCSPNATPNMTTVYTLAVTAATGCSSTNNPTVTVTVTATPEQPVITAPLSLPVGASGASASVASHPSSTYNWTLTGGTITGGQTTRQIIFDAGGPGTTMLCTVVESTNGCLSPLASKKIQVDFLDVPPSNTYHDFVNTVARNEITVGCGNGNYCGGTDIKRSQMAVFLLKSKFGSTHIPPPATGTVFGDVGAGDFAAAWIEELAALGISTGCGGGNYCPDAPVRRDEMAVFLLKTSLGSGYVPPPASGTIFSDVPLGVFAVDWIEDLYNRGVTGGCNVNPLRYCPANSNTREQMAVFVTKTFGLQ
ncbi:MAG: right-handed parallel beta-helix repeat-containing protein [Acidobacteriota bacterium]